MLDRKRLSIYLNDHLAGSTAGLELAKRTRGANQGTDYGEPLERIARQIEEDRDALIGLMESLEIKRDHLKVAAGWVAEKLGRLKPNGQLTGYSPLSRLIELEGLAVGITGKQSLWDALLEISDKDARLDAAQLRRLSTRAQEQRDEVWNLRQRAARETFSA
jgi:hypothetical protein